MKLRGTHKEMVEVELDRFQLVDAVEQIIRNDYNLSHDKYIRDGNIMEDEDMGHGSPIERNLGKASAMEMQAYITILFLKKIRYDP